MEECGGIRFLAPVDPDFGGTWIAVNEHGLSFCLLNSGAGQAACPSRSRGLLIRELIWTRSIDDSTFLLTHLDLGVFAPFTLLLLEPGLPAIVAAWDGANLTVCPGDSQMPLTSSSYDAQGVRRFRWNEFGRRVGPSRRVDPALLYWFHSSHDSSPDAYSPCMHRDDAETVSFSWVIVTPQEIRFLYSPSAPCRCSPSEQQVLARAA